MPATITTIQRIGPRAWRYTWSGTAPFDVWIDGAKVLDQTTLLTYIAQGDNSHTPPALEIRDAADTGLPQSVTYSPIMRFQWRGQTDASLYIVQQYIGSTWTTQNAVRETGRGYYTYSTLAQDDGTLSQWRILPQDSRGYRGAAVTFSQTIIRNPPPPTVLYAYDEGTTTLTVSAAS
jgi:hypothetical protein